MAKAAHLHHIVLSASSSYSYSMLSWSNFGSRPRIINCRKGQTWDSGPQFCPQQSLFPPLGVTNVPFVSWKSAFGLQQMHIELCRCPWCALQRTSARSRGQRTRHEQQSEVPKNSHEN